VSAAARQQARAARRLERHSRRGRLGGQPGPLTAASGAVGEGDAVAAEGGVGQLAGRAQRRQQQRAAGAAQDVERGVGEGLQHLFSAVLRLGGAGASFLLGCRERG
jgi:hypothetical protein